MSRESSDPKKPTETAKDWIPERIGSWRCLERIGQGGMGDVFLCEDEKKTRRVAVKLMRPSTADDPEALKRFKSEAEILQRIQSSRVASLIEFGAVELAPYGNVHYMAMEYVEGRSLNKLIRLKRLTFPEILSIGRQIGEAVAAIHAQGFLHRDLKPENIMVTDEGLVKLIDFGVAKPVSKDGSKTDADDFRDLKTKTGFAVGTTYYMAPEIVGGRAASFQSDIYSLGLIIWEMAVAKTPFKSQKLSEILRNIEEQSLSWPDPIVDIAPAGLLSFVNRLMSKTPEKRPESALEVANELGRILEQAEWPDVLNRRTKFAEAVWWDNSVLDRCKSEGLLDCEIPLALPAIEDRVKGTYPFSEEAIDAGIASYKSARYQCAMKRQGELRERMQSGPAPGAAKTPRPSKVAPKAFSRPDSKPAGSKAMFFVTAGLCLLLAFVTKKSGVFDRVKSASARLPASTEVEKTPTTEKTSIPAVAASEPLTFHFTAENSDDRGLSGSGLVETQFTRTRIEQNNERTLWKLQNGETRSVPRGVLPLEVLFSSAGVAVSGANGAQPESFLSAFEKNRTWIVVAEKSTYECARKSMQRNKVGARDFEVWDIECKVSKRDEKGEVLESTTETYKYAPELEMMLAALQSTKVFGTGGQLVRERESSLNIDSARFPGGR